MEPTDTTNTPDSETPLPSGWVWVAKYLSRELRGTEEAAFTKWLSDDPARVDALERLRASWDEHGHVPSSIETDAALANVFARAGVQWPVTEHAPSHMRSPRIGSRGMGRGTPFTRRPWSIGALSACVALIAVFAISRNWRSAFATEPLVAHAYATDTYHEGIVPLSDGSRIVLAPGTTLRTTRFGNNSRMVILDRGEAYFDVTSSNTAPFVVKSGSISTQVLGTSFLVRRYEGEDRVRVSVVSGKVHVSSQPDHGVIVTAGHVGEITDSTVHTVAVDDVSPRVEWQNDQLVFHDTPIATVLKTLERWYGYHFICADSTLPPRNVNIVVSTGSSAAALAKLETILAVNLTVVGDTITLTPHGRSAKQAPQGRHYDVWTFPREVGR